jgi:hypothetical protein
MRGVLPLRPLYDFMAWCEHTGMLRFRTDRSNQFHQPVQAISRRFRIVESQVQSQVFVVDTVAFRLVLLPRLPLSPASYHSTEVLYSSIVKIWYNMPISSRSTKGL